MIQNIEKKIFTNVFYQILGKLVTSFIGFFVSILIARNLGVIGFGQYNLIFTFLGLIGIIADFGLATLLIREVSAKRADEKYFAGVFTLRLFLALLLLIIAFLGLPFFPYPFVVKKGIVIVLFGNIFLSLSSIFWAVFQAKLRFLNVVLIQVFSSVFVGLLVIFGVIKSMSLIFFVLANALGNFFGFLLSFKFSFPYKMLLIFDKKLFRKIFKDVWPIGLWAIVSTFYFKIDTIILSLFFDPEKTQDLGIYSAAYKYFEVGGVFLGFFQLTVFPVVCANLKRKFFSKMLKRLVLITIILSIFSTVLLISFSSLLVSLFGRQFLPAVSSLRILSLSLGLSVLAGIWLAIAIAGEKQKKILYFSIMALVLNLTLNFLLVPKMSFLGASWANFFTQLFITITNFLVAKEVFKK